MIKSKTVAGLALLLLMLATASVCFGKGKVLFEEDFEEGEIDKDVWIPTGSWKIVDGVSDCFVYRPPW